MTVLPVLLAIAWLVPAVLLLLDGRLRPAPLILISVPLAVLLIAAVTRHVPRQRPVTVPGAAGEPSARARAWAGWGGLGGTIAVAAGFAAWQIVLNSPQLIVVRNPGAQFQLGYWLAGHGSLPIPAQLGAFGGAHPGLRFASTGFASASSGPARTAGLAPQFMPGLAVFLAGGWWAHGMTGAALISPVIGAVAVLTAGGLAGRLAGPQWAPAAALVLALSLPEVYTSRAAFTEPLVQLLLLGGLCLVVDALATQPGRPQVRGYPGPLAWPRWLQARAATALDRLARWPVWLTPGTAAAALGGLAIGLTSAVSLAALPYLIPLIPFLGVAVVGRRPQVVPFSIGVLGGIGCGMAAALVTAPAHLGAPGFPVRTMALITAIAALATLAAVLAALWEPARSRARRVVRGAARWWVPEVTAGLVAAGLIAFLVRPSFQTARWSPTAGTAGYVAALQRLLGLPVQPGRSYAEDSMYWVIWYIGIPAVLLGAFGAALLARRCVRALLRWRDEDGTARAWALPLTVLGWGAVWVLWAPSTVPDHPWASRVLVPAVLPGFILCAAWVAAMLDGRARERGAGLAAVGAAAACFTAALAVPTAVTTFNASFGRTGPGQPALVRLRGLGVERTGAGQDAAIQQLCGAMSARMSVLIVDRPAADEFTQVVRGMCHVPTAVMAGAPAAEVRAEIQAISAHGRDPVLLATHALDLAHYVAPPRKALGLATTQEPHDLTQPPPGPWPISYELWMVTAAPVPGL